MDTTATGIGWIMQKTLKENFTYDPCGTFSGGNYLAKAFFGGSDALRKKKNAATKRQYQRERMLYIT